MYLVFRKNREILLSINLNKYSFDDLIFGQDTVKEILITKIIESNDDIGKLSELYDLMNNYYQQADEVILMYNNNFYNVFHFPIKKILYRTMHYMNAGDLRIQECLSVRFVEDNLVTINPEEELLICDEKCLYFDNNHCNKYGENITNHICQQCFLEMYPIIELEKTKLFWEDRYNNE